MSYSRVGLSFVRGYAQGNEASAADILQHPGDDEMDNIGKLPLITGITIAVIGLLFILAPKIPFLGKPPGDIMLRRGDATLYFPIATSIIISVVLTVLLNIAFRLFR